MEYPGSCQPGTQSEAAAVLSQRKRSTDLVRQAQFAACSYLGFDPYEELNKNGLAQQVPVSETSVPVELHLHHHHHHHCRENAEILKRPSHMPTNTDAPLGVGSLLSICDHIQLFQDAWQGHGKVDERSHKFMLHGSLIKRDNAYAGCEGSIPSHNGKKDKVRERNVPSVERYWNGHNPGIGQPILGNDHQQVNTTARISHWECSVIQEEKLTKGSIGQPERSRSLSVSTESERGQCMSLSSIETTDNVIPSDFSWGPTSKFGSSCQVNPTPNNPKPERNVLGDFNTQSSSQVPFSVPARKFGSTVSKRKKSSDDADAYDNQSFSGSSDATPVSKMCLDSRKANHTGQIEQTSGGMKKLAVTGQPSNFPLHQGCEVPLHEQEHPNTDLISPHVGKTTHFLHKRVSSNCAECTCQQSLSDQLSSFDEKQEGVGVAHGMMRDGKDDSDSSSIGGKQSFLSEKIISLDDSENGETNGMYMMNRQDMASLKKQDQVIPGKKELHTSAMSIKAGEECASNPVSASLIWDGTLEKREYRSSRENGIGKHFNKYSTNENVELENGIFMETQQGSPALKDLLPNATRRNGFHDSILQGCSLAQKEGDQLKTKQDVGVQIQIKDEELIECNADRKALLQKKYDKVIHSQKGACMESAFEDLRHKVSCLPPKVQESHSLNKKMLSSQINHGTVGISEDLIQACDTGNFVLESLNSETEIIYKESFPQAISGTLRVHQQLELEKSRHESSKKDLEQVKKDYDEFLRDLGTPNCMQRSSLEKEASPKHLLSVQEKDKKRLTAEVEARLAAEEKARLYEVSAEAAESRLLQLLDERTKLHLKFDEELEQKEAERVRLQDLFEKEKLKSEAAKRELQEVRGKFAALISRTPASPKSLQEVVCEKVLTPRLPSDVVSRQMDILEKHEILEKKEEQSGPSGKCSRLWRSFEILQDGKHFLQGRNTLSKEEGCLLLQVRQRELQLKTAEDAFQELERKLKRVEIDKGAVKGNLESARNHKDVKHVEKAIQTNCWDDGVYEKYSYVYQSPIFEHAKLTTSKPRKMDPEALSEVDTDGRALSRKEVSEDQTDMEIRQLTEELKIIGADMLSHKIQESNLDLVPVGADGSKHLNLSFDAANKQTAELEITNKALKRKLKEKNAQLNKMLTQHTKELQRLQNSSNQADQMNKQLASNLASTEAKLSEVQTHYDGLLTSAECQLKEALADTELFKKTVDELHQKLSESEKRLLEFKDSAEQQEWQLTDLKKNLQELQNEKGTLAKDKADLTLKLQDLSKELNEQTARVAEYLSINEELLEFAQRKENEVNSLNQQVQILQQQVTDKGNENLKVQSDLEKARKEMNEVQKTYNSLQSEHEVLKAKLSENNLQLLQQEGTIGTLTKQMADIMEGRDSMLEEAAQFHGYLQNAKYKEFELENELRQSNLVIKDLEEKLKKMESEMLKSKSELADTRRQNSVIQKLAEDKGQEALDLRKSVNELRKKVQDLEEEVLLKEGQMAILSSYRGDPESTF